MKYKERLVSQRLKTLVAHFPVVVVSGARQVGKSTLINKIFPDWDAVVFDPVLDVGNARSDPELFLKNRPIPLVLDEIQYCPELVPSIKRWVDRENKRPGMYILTGSQQWSVMKSIGESLAGRAVFLDMESFSQSEISEQVDEPSWLERYLDAPELFISETRHFLPSGRTIYESIWRGTLPEADRLPEALLGDFFSGYLRTYIERDVRQMLEVEDGQQFGRFAQLAAALSAQEINHSQFGREIGVTPQTAKRWLAVLKATYQWTEIPAYHGNMLKKLSLKPKGYFSDTGLACHLNRITTPEALGGHPMAGALFEALVVADIRKLLQPLSRKATLYHWRLHSGSEVDLVLERDGCLYPMEIKLNSRPKGKDARGIRAFGEQGFKQRVAPGLIIAPADRFEQVAENAYVLPWNTC